MAVRRLLSKSESFGKKGDRRDFNKIGQMKA